MGDNFTLWELHPLFSAAEDVQLSADRLESAYRAWIHGSRAAHGTMRSSGAHRKELITAFETTKWQLEEFERAFTKTNLKDHRTERALARYRPFIEAISHQISLVETDIRNSGNEEYGHSLHAVSIGDGDRDRDELAKFLLGNQMTGKNDQNGYTYPREEYQAKGELTSQERAQTLKADEIHQNMVFGSQLHGFQDRENISVSRQEMENSLILDRVLGPADHSLSDKKAKQTDVGRRNGSIENGFVDRKDGMDAISDRIKDHRKSKNRYQYWNSWFLSSWQYLGGKLQHSRSGLKRYKDGELDSMANSWKETSIGCVQNVSDSELEKGKSSSLSTIVRRWNGFSFVFHKAKQSALFRNKYEQNLLHSHAVRIFNFPSKRFLVLLVITAVSVYCWVFSKSMFA